MVVEGYTDVLALHGAGIEETVAIMGTALTNEQLIELGRAATTVLMALDADASGQEAMLRAARAATERGMELRVVALPEGNDPAELVAAQGAASFERLLSAAVSVPEFEAARVLDAADLATTHGRDRALEQVRPLVAGDPGAEHRARRARAARDRSARGAGGVCDRRWRRSRDRTGVQRPGIAGARRPAAPGRRTAARRAATAPLRPPPPSAESGPSSPCAWPSRRLAASCSERADEAYLSPRFLPVRDHLLAHPDDPLAKLPADPEQAALVTEIAMLAEAEPATELDVRLSFLQLELRRADRELRVAARARDYDRQRALWAERERLREQFDELMGTLG